jgi:predicted small lipoprotein YifL
MNGVHFCVTDREVKMKKLLSLVTVMMLTASLAACGSSQPAETTAAETEAAVETEAVTEAAETEAVAETAEVAEAQVSEEPETDEEPAAEPEKEEEPTILDKWRGWLNNLMKTVTE